MILNIICMAGIFLMLNAGAIAWGWDAKGWRWPVKMLIAFTMAGAGLQLIRLHDNVARALDEPAAATCRPWERKI